MKTIGLIGGMSFESTIEYYRTINQLMKERLGGWHSAKIIMYSVDFAEIHEHQNTGNWESAGELLAQAGRKIENGGADLIVLCTNTMHKVANYIEQATKIPLVHIADATAEKIIASGIKKVGLLGTKYTMEQDFYKDRLRDKYALEVIVPNSADIAIINEVIFSELVLGKINSESQKAYVKIINKLLKQGAEGIILGCTEIGLLIKEGAVPCPIFDTTYLHSEKAVEIALDTVRL